MHQLKIEMSKASLTTYGVTHAVVDAASAATVMSAAFLGVDAAALAFLILLYDVIAFAFQAPIGLLCDRFKLPKRVALAGIILTGLAVFLLQYNPVAAICLVGLGNALFHVGAGSAVLQAYKGKASGPGLFVAPGAIGLALGTIIGKTGLISPIPFGLALAICAFFVLRTPNIENAKRKARMFLDIKPFYSMLFLLLLSVAIRAFLGFAIAMPWKSDAALMWALVLSIAAGKALGGIVADRFGWMKTSVASLVVSAPLLAFASTSPAAGIIGFLLFNMTMPITLVALFKLMPGLPGFSFGLACLGLIIGSLVAFSGTLAGLGSSAFYALCTLASAGALTVALKTLKE